MSGTAEVHPQATLTPTKLELVTRWLPSQPWFDGDVTDLEQVGAFRLTDPYGEVGMETLLLRAGETTYQVPLTYRGEALDGAEEYLVGETEHSELGHRWVYDGVGDPEYVDELLRVIRDGDTEAALSTGQAPTATALGSGVELVANSSGQLKLHRVVDPAPEPHATRASVGTLDGTWTTDGVQHTATLVDLY